jgi:hypothetical protein
LQSTKKERSEMRNKKIFTIAVLLGVLFSGSVTAQRKSRQQRVVQTKPALIVVNNPTPTFHSGEVNVLVQGDENPIIRLQMVANGQALIEFPAQDRIFKVNPSDPDVVTIEDSPTKERDRYILLRSSKQFLPGSAGGTSAATSMLVQMTSGMVVTLVIYPVLNLEQVVHRCVVRYDREAIVGARQVAGLAVNLDQQEGEEKPKAAMLSLPFAAPAKPIAVEVAPGFTTEIAKPAVNTPVHTPAPECATARCAPPIVRATPIKLPNGSKEKPDLWDRVGSGKLKWSAALHGLKAAAQTRVLDGTNHLVAVSVINTLSVPLKIVPQQPELCVQTLDEQGRVLQVEPVRLLKPEASRPSEFLAPGEIARYVIAYEAPILGAKQRLCVLVAQTNAADEPIVIELTNGMR